MSYDKFTNLGQTLQGDLMGKLMDGITSIDFKPRKCNCHKSAKGENGVCAYNGECRRSIVVYKAHCKKNRSFLHWKHPTKIENEDDATLHRNE